MTILVGIALGTTKEKPFSLLASDSRSATIDVYHNADFEIRKQEVVSFNENTKKVHKLNPNLYMGFAGNGFGEQSDDEVQLIKSWLSFPDEIDLKEAATSIRSYFFNRLYELKNEFYSYDIILAGKHEGKPGLAGFVVSHNTINTDIEIQYSIPLPGQVMFLTSGEKVPQIFKDKLHQQVNMSNGSLTKTRLAVTEYIQKASELFDSCNNIVQVERVK